MVFHILFSQKKKKAKPKSDQIVILFPNINTWALQECVCHMVNSLAGGLCHQGNKFEILKVLCSGNQDFIYL